MFLHLNPGPVRWSSSSLSICLSPSKCPLRSSGRFQADNVLLRSIQDSLLDADGGEEVEIRKSHLDGLWSRLTSPFDYNHDLIPKVDSLFSLYLVQRISSTTPLSLKAKRRVIILVIINIVCMPYALTSSFHSNIT